MAFLAKQFMSLLLLLTISRLILSTHAVRQYFSQVSRTTTPTTTTTQPAFYENVGDQHGLDTSPPPPRPSNYDAVMYTTSHETQKNMYDKYPTVAETYGAYSNNPFSNSNQYKENKKPNTESEEVKKYDNSYKSNNQFQQVEPSEANKYDPSRSSSKFSQQYGEYKEQKYPTTVPVNQFYQHNNQFQQENEQAKKYDPYGHSSKYSQQYIEAEEKEKENKKEPTQNQFGYNYNPFQQAYDPNGLEKHSNSKYYANDDDDDNAELDEVSNDQEKKYGPSNTPNYKVNSVPAKSYQKNGKYNDWETWQAYGQKQEKDNKYADSETYSKNTNNDDKHFAMTDEELNAILDEEEKQDENEIESPPNGMSDTRWTSNKQYYQPNNWKQHTDLYANAFSGKALTDAVQNNP